MTSEYNAPNVDLQVRTIFDAAAGTNAVDGILSTHKLESLPDEDSNIWFWREIERQFDIAITKAQRQSLPTVGHLIHYLKVRTREEAKLG